MTAQAPNFMIVGVQKTGTTFLAKHLAAHPDVFFARPKELFFFNAPRVSDAEFQDYLTKSFGNTGGCRWVGEGSTNYFHHRRAIGFIEKYLGTGMRILVCLRHPVERAFSHYLHDYRKGRRSGAERLDDDAWRGYLARGLYADRLEIWNGRFACFKPMIFDDLVRDGREYYAQAARFLDIEPQAIDDRPVNEGLHMAWEGATLTISAAPPQPGQTAPRFRIEEVEALGARYADDIKRTEDFLKRDLRAWGGMPTFAQAGAKSFTTSETE